MSPTSALRPVLVAVVVLLALAALPPAVAPSPAASPSAPRLFVAKLSARSAGVNSTGSFGDATIQILSPTRAVLSFEVGKIRGITSMQLHIATPPASGPAVLTLYQPQLNGMQQPVSGHFKTAKGMGIPFDPSQNSLLDQLQQGHVYMNVQTLAYPAGEIRGTFNTTAKGG